MTRPGRAAISLLKGASPSIQLLFLFAGFVTPLCLSANLNYMDDCLLHDGIIYLPWTNLDYNFCDKWDLETQKFLDTAEFPSGEHWFQFRAHGDHIYTHLLDKLLRTSDGGASWETVIDNQDRIKGFYFLGNAIVVKTRPNSSNKDILQFFDITTLENVREQEYEGWSPIAFDHDRKQLVANNTTKYDLFIQSYDEAGNMIGEAHFAPQDDRDPRWHGRTYFSPDGRRVYESVEEINHERGLVRSTEALDLIWEIEAFEQVVIFPEYPNNPIFLRRPTISTPSIEVTYEDLTVERILEPTVFPRKIFIHENKLVLFGADLETRVNLEAQLIPVESLQLKKSALPIWPENMEFNIDQAFLTSDKKLLLISRSALAALVYDPFTKTFVTHFDLDEPVYDGVQDPITKEVYLRFVDNPSTILRWNHTGGNYLNPVPIYSTIRDYTVFDDFFILRPMYESHLDTYDSSGNHLDRDITGTRIFEANLWPYSGTWHTETRRGYFSDGYDNFGINNLNIIELSTEGTLTIVEDPDRIGHNWYVPFHINPYPDRPLLVFRGGEFVFADTYTMFPFTPMAPASLELIFTPDGGALSLGWRDKDDVNDPWDTTTSVLRQLDPDLQEIRQVELTGNPRFFFKEGNLLIVVSDQDHRSLIHLVDAETFEVYPSSGFWTNATMDDSWWLSLPWFGQFRTSSHGWIYHRDKTWLFPSSGKSESFYFYDVTKECWSWSSSDIYPHVYRLAPFNEWVLSSL